MVVCFQARRGGFRHVFRLHSLKEGVDAPEVDLLPLVGRVVVTLGALNLLTKEKSRRTRGEGDRVEFKVGEDVINRPILLVGTRRRHQLVDDFVPRPIGVELLSKPARQRWAIDHAALVLAADQEDGPLRRGILGVVGMIEEVLDQFSPLIALTRNQERPRLLHVRDSTQKVEICASQEFIVRRRLRGFDSRLGPSFFDQLIDESRLKDGLLGGR